LSLRSDPADDVLADLADHPGFLIRRAQQVAVALFNVSYEAHGVTPTQALVLHVVARSPGIDQMTVARLLGLDRSTGAMVVAALAEAGYLTRPVDGRDRRRRVLAITASGTALLERMGPFAASRDTLLAAFTPAEAATFVRLLRQFVEVQQRRLAVADRPD
jgi:DNA-binding MarR family transcriptional regulator